MNDKDRELLQQILEAGGTAAHNGFAALVRWQFMDGLTTVLGTLFVIAICAFAFQRLMKWKPDDSDAHMIRGPCIAATLIVAAVAAGFSLPNGLRDLFAPEGAAVYVLLHH